MIISDKYKLIFVRIPKTGSTSIENALKLADPDCISSDSNNPPHGHYSDAELKKAIGEDKWNDYFKFCTFRDPMDWILSMYVYNARFTFKRSDPIRFSWFFRNEECSLPFDPSNPIIGIEEFMKLHILNKEWFKPQECYLQTHWISLGDMDCILDFKDLNKEWDALAKQFGFSSHLGLDNVNKARKELNDSGNPVKLSDDAKTLFSILYAKDIEFYKHIKYEERNKLSA
jgi:hypothetical protein